jgi:cellulose synthase/poly-beta-1,6-N-acetylglucosamine synthase-like glycosyltransferase
MKVSIIIPVYNEFRTFSQVLGRVRNAPLPAGVGKEIIVVDDGSTDGTSSLVAGCAGAMAGRVKRKANRQAAQRTKDAGPHR